LVWTLPKILRVFFRHHKRLHGEINRLLYDLVCDFITAAAGKPIRTAAVMVFQSSGQFARWNPHWHGLFLEGGFGPESRFLHVPTVVLAKNMLEWAHGGFSLDASIRIPAGSAKTREALAQYIVRRPPVSEGSTDTVVYRAPYNDYFRTDTKVFPAIEFLVEVLQNLPDSRSRLLRTYGLYSSRARGTPGPAAARQRCGRVGA
jgi:hypothetical protein